MSLEAVCNPLITFREVTSIAINWASVFPAGKDKSYLDTGTKKRALSVVKPSQERIYDLRMQDSVNEWRIVYWGRRTETVVTNLQPCTVYVFRIKLIQENAHERNQHGCHGESHWLEFRAATSADSSHVACLTRMIKYGKTAAVRRIITNRTYLLESLNVEDKTPLMQATECGKLELVQLLCTLGTNVNAQSLVSQRTALMLALFHGFVKIARVLLKENASVHIRDVNDRTALHYAIDGNCLEAVKFALEHGAVINSRDDKGWTPLLRAAILDVEDDIVKHLMRSESDYSAVDERGLDFRKYLELSNRKHLLT